MFSANSNSLAASSDPLSAAVATATFASYSSKSNPPKWSQHSESFYQGLLQEDGSNNKKKLGGHPPSDNRCNNNDVSESQPNSKFKIDNSLKPTTNDSCQPKPPTTTKREGHSSLSDSNKRPKTQQIEPREKTFRLDVEILFANDPKHRMQSPSSSWEGNIILKYYALELMHIYT